MRAFLIVVIASVTLAAQTAGPQVTSQDQLDGLKDPTRWLTNGGDYSGHRHSPLTQITPENVNQLAAQWTFQTGTLGSFQTTPIVIDGVLYVTGFNNNAWAIDARSGRTIWRYRRDLPEDWRGCCGAVNRGFGVLGDRLFMTTIDAHLVALDMRTGGVLFDVELADYKLGYSATVAPLIVKDKVISASPAPSTASAGSSTPTTRRPASARGASTPSPDRATRAPRRGRKATPTCAAAARSG